MTDTMATNSIRFVAGWLAEILRATIKAGILLALCFTTIAVAVGPFIVLGPKSGDAWEISLIGLLILGNIWWFDVISPYWNRRYALRGLRERGFSEDELKSVTAIGNELPGSELAILKSLEGFDRNQVVDFTKEIADYLDANLKKETWGYKLCVLVPFFICVLVCLFAIGLISETHWDPSVVVLVLCAILAAWIIFNFGKRSKLFWRSNGV